MSPKTKRRAVFAWMWASFALMATGMLIKFLPASLAGAISLFFLLSSLGGGITWTQRQRD